MQKHWKQKDIIFLLERLHLYLKAGIPLDRACEVAAEGSSGSKKEYIRFIKEGLLSGGSFAALLSRYVGVNDTVRSLIAHGESSASLASTIEMSRALLERSQEVRSKCLSALAYPSIIGIFAAVLTIGLVRGVMPQIIPMLRGLHVELPLITRIVVAASDYLTRYGVYAALGAIVGSATVGFLYRRTPWLKQFIHTLISRIPIIGELVRSVSVSLFLRSCGTLIEGGLSSPEAYSRTAGSVPFGPVRKSLISVVEKARQGVQFKTLFAACRMPSHTIQLASAGEMTGTLGASLVRSADIIDRDIDHSLKRLTALIEPIMMAGMGGVVGSIALSIMMPIYDVSKMLQH